MVANLDTASCHAEYCTYCLFLVCVDHSSIGLSESDFELAEESGKRPDIPQVEETVYMSDEVEELGQVSGCVTSLC